MIELAGISVRDQTPELQAMLDGIWTPDWETYRQPLMNSASTTFHLPVGAQQPCMAPPKLGVLRWPTDLTRWATCYLMVTDQELRDIIKVVGSGYGYGAALKISDGTNSILAYQMQILPPRPICQTSRKWDDPYPSTATPDLWLLPLVDWRFFNQQSSIKFPYYNTWNNLIGNAIANFSAETGGSSIVDTIPTEYGTPNNDYWLGNAVVHTSQVQYCQAAIDYVGARASVDIHNNIRVWRPLNAKAVHKAAWNANINNMIAGGLLNIVDIVNAVPEAVSVYFDDYPPSSTIGSRGVQTWYLNALSISEAAGINGTIANTGLYCDSALWTSGGGVAWNATDDRNNAKQFAIDWYNWRFASRVDATFRGIIDWPLSGAEWCVEWSSGCYGTQPTTRVYPLPLFNWNRYGAPQVKRMLRTDVAGSKAGNAALSGLLTWMSNQGLINDQTT